ncbi:MAG: hypothetical protein CME59_16520 [Halioglobus sp.]|nr:hypothetical protein [Halioglobus sp.]|tara:strand:- start:779 stop:2080 length:1302 start_codon:yes stop_codon:yes gene_type:complete
MVHWNSSPHPISDIRDWSEAGRLELRPDFQRREVWSATAKVMLMDTIIRDVPMPKIFLANTIRQGKTYRVVIDGQQRITAILDFLRDRFTLDSPYSGEEKGKKFSELDQDLQDRFLSYRIDFNEAINPTEDEVREVYSRVNKYTVPLTKQELRRADFPGDFLQISEELSVEEYFDQVGIFSAANRRRYADVEYVSELLAAMIGGIQDKKDTLDDFYVDYSAWEKSHKEKIVSRFYSIFSEMGTIFDESLVVSRTRFKQKADFYTLFLVIDDFVKEGFTAQGKDLDPLREDLNMLQETIRPESDIEICSEYAIKCVSQANSASSRRWRHQFVRAVLAGTYTGRSPDEVGARIFYRLFEDLSQGDSSGMCPSPVFECPVCEEEISDDFSECMIAWHRTAPVRQITNASWVHISCVNDQAEWLVTERPNDDQPNLL